MDNVKTDSYYIQKIQNDLKFIVEHMRNVDIEELNVNEVLLDSMLFRMIQLSENAKKLSDEYKLRHSVIKTDKRNKETKKFGRKMRMKCKSSVEKCR